MTSNFRIECYDPIVERRIYFMPIIYYEIFESHPKFQIEFDF